jgi:hypothetical protein
MKRQRRELTELRNRKIIERFCWWTDVKRRRLDDVLVILSREEFFVSETTILRVIKDNKPTGL